MYRIAVLALLFPALGLTPRQELKVEVLDKLKSATVYVVVNDGGMKGTGSGFLFLKRGTTGYVMTCEHVVGGAPTVKVVFWSGIS